MKSLIAIVLAGLMAAACGANECEEAVERLAECDGIDTKDVDVDQCDGITECIAKCATNATCTEIKSTDPNSNYNQCLLSC